MALPPGRVGARGTHAESVGWEGPEAGWGRAAGPDRPPGSRAPSCLASPPPFFLPEPVLGHHRACLAGSHPLPHPGFFGGRPLPFSRGCWAGGSGRTARKTTSRNFPARATFPHLGDCPSQGEEVRASSLCGRFYNLHGNYFRWGRADSLIG